jgi:hypothetical protein
MWITASVLCNADLATYPPPSDHQPLGDYTGLSVGDGITHCGAPYVDSHGRHVIRTTRASCYATWRTIALKLQFTPPVRGSEQLPQFR